MNIVRVVAVARHGGNSYENSKLVLLCGIDENHQLEDGEWMGYLKGGASVANQYPFILRERGSILFGGLDPVPRTTNLASGEISVGRLFTLATPDDEVDSVALTFEITSCHQYADALHSKKR